MRGQKSRPGPGVRKGFEGGQMPLYRRIPKLRGIARAWRYACGVAKICPRELKRHNSSRIPRGDEVLLETLKEKGLINPSGRERTLPLKLFKDYCDNPIYCQSFWYMEIISLSGRNL
ncbi:hypothetical protein Peur_055161 [Populus x canadensis]